MAKILFENGPTEFTEFFFIIDSKNDDQSKKILEQLETIDDDCDRHGIILVKLDNAEEAAQYGQAHHIFSRFMNLKNFHKMFFVLFFYKLEVFCSDQKS